MKLFFFLSLLLLVSSCANQAPAPAKISQDEAQELLKNLVVVQGERLSVVLRKFGCQTEVSTIAGSGIYKIDPDLGGNLKSCDGHARGMVDTFTVALKALMAYENSAGKPFTLQIPTRGEAFALALAQSLKEKWKGSLEQKYKLLHSALLTGDGLSTYRPLFEAIGYGLQSIDMEKLGPYPGLSRDFKRELSSKGFAGSDALLRPAHLRLSLHPLSKAP